MSEVPTRLLRETLGAQLTPPSSGCIDADTLAAWSDGTLGGRERAAAESHASSCARCQALVAAMIRTAPAPAPESRWSVWSIRWLTPIAAAAAALVMWIYPVSQYRQPLTKAGAEARATAPQTILPPASSTVAPTVSQAPATATPAPAQETRRTTPARNRGDAQTMTERMLAPAAPPTSDTAKREVRADEDARARSERTSPPSAVAESTAALQAPAAPPPPAPAEASRQPATAGSKPAANAASGASAPGLLPSARALSDVSASGLRAQAAAKMLAAPTEIVSPDARIRWRILTAGNVARSVDAGATWQTQATGALVNLTAGHAPSPTICWLVGPGGVVLLSTDGRTWQRVSLPESIDLASVRATDAATASVTAADGRTFVTSDGGKTWR